MEAAVVSVSSSLVFFVNSVQKMCTSAPYHITMTTRILGAQYSSNIFRLYLNISISILKCHLKYISEKYIKPISEKYIKSKLKVYFTIFLFKRSLLITNLNKHIFCNGIYKMLCRNYPKFDLTISFRTENAHSPFFQM